MKPNGRKQKLPFIYEKFIAMVTKRSEEGSPRTRLEENMARDFRLCRDDVKKIFAELHLGNLEEKHTVKKKKVVRALPEYSPKTEEDFLNDLQNYR